MLKCGTAGSWFHVQMLAQSPNHPSLLSPLPPLPPPILIQMSTGRVMEAGEATNWKKLLYIFD